VTAAEVRFVVRLTPRGGADRVDGVVDGVLRIRVAAPPVEDAANRSLLRLLARELGVAPSAVRIVAGATGRRKTIAIDGTTAQAILIRWPGLRL
jgi:uncharacterized protein YggU (UPF0235/DUF167 family)